MEEYDKKYYKISEVAEILLIPASTLRFWERQFTVVKPRRNSHGTRFYTPADIEAIRMICYLVKDKGLKLDAAEQQIRSNRSGVSRHASAVNRLRDIRKRLVEILDTLDTRRMPRS